MHYLNALKKGGARISPYRLFGRDICTASIILPMFIIAVLIPALVVAQPPPEYSTFGREQKTEYTPDDSNLLRIWMVNVGQGDGLIIQLPPKYDYSVDTNDDVISERIDILIDGGSWTNDESKLIGHFLDRLYPDYYPIIEYAVITHHDVDHIKGLTNLLKDTNIVFGTIYHNGLATYRGGTPRFRDSEISDDNAIYKKGKETLGMAFLDSQGRIKSAYLVSDINRLKSDYNNNYYADKYKKLAEAVTARWNDGGLDAFDRVYAGASFIVENSSANDMDLSGIGFEVLWPLSTLREYGKANWSKTINGNSVTFKLTYGKFEMLFTGDLNKESETELYNHLSSAGQLDKLKCDVLKVPHHGSDDIYKKLFTDHIIDPVISVASMGDMGFRLNHGYKHPKPEVVELLGGAHRFYSTYIHEKKFKWESMTENKLQKMIEKRRKDILIETDGIWFRVVEITTGGDPNTPPKVAEVRRGHGTRWISAD